MSIEETRRHIQETLHRNVAANEERSRQKRIDAACPLRDEHGNRVRGYVTRVRCMHCHSIKFDDGTPCRACGHKRFADLNAEDEGRLA